MPHTLSRTQAQKALTQRLLGLAAALTLALLGSLPGQTEATAATAADSYAKLGSYKAQAAYGNNPGATYTSADQPNRLAAAVNAQQACLQAHPQQSPEAGFCELTYAGEADLTTTAEILQQLPDEPHPLFLWQYKAPGATVYLAGSIHILKPGLYPLPRQFQAAFDSADTLVLEVNLEALDAAELQTKTIQYGVLQHNTTLQQVLPAETYTALDNVSQEYGLPLAQLGNLKPALISQQLTVSALVAVGYDPRSGVDVFFSRQASETNKKIQQLETIDQQLDLLLNQPIDVQVQLMQDALAQMTDFESMTAGLISAWLSGNDQQFMQLFNAQSGSSPAAETFMRQLIDERNIAMAEKINNMLNTGGTYFVLVGAGHYIGDNSIIKLLQARGVEGKRVFSNQDIKNL
ncbi:MAG: TraB/GumN family protein [Pseudomonadota bacterium]